MSQESDLRQAKQIAYRMLARRGRSKQEMRDKLAEKGIAPSLIEQVIHDLVDYGYLNDDAFAHQLARSLFTTRGWGFSRIAFTLRSRGVPEDLVDTTIAKLRKDNSEEKTASSLLERRFSHFNFRTASLKEKHRVVDFLQRRGFSWETINRVIRT